MTAIGFLIIVISVALYRRGGLSAIITAGAVYAGVVLVVTGLATWLWQTLP